MDLSVLVMAASTAGIVIGLVLLPVGAGATGRGAIVRGGVYLLFGGGLVLAGLVLLPLGALLATWQPLPADTVVGRLTVRIDEGRQGVVTVSRPGQLLGEPYVVRGALWHLQGQLLRFSPLGTGLGLTDHYRLDKLASVRAGGEDPIGTSFEPLPPPSSLPGVVYWLAGIAEHTPWVDSVAALRAGGPAGTAAAYRLVVSDDTLVAEPEAP